MLVIWAPEGNNISSTTHVPGCSSDHWKISRVPYVFTDLVSFDISYYGQLTFTILKRELFKFNGQIARATMFCKVLLNPEHH